MRSDCIGLDEHGRAVVRTRAWSRLVTEGQGELANGYPPGSPPLKLAEAYMPAPIAWALLCTSSLGAASSAVLALAFGTVEGAAPMTQSLAAAGGVLVGLGGPPLAASSIVVELDPTSVLATGERLSVCLAPLVWPPWTVPEDARRLTALLRGGHAPAR